MWNRKTKIQVESGAYVSPEAKITGTVVISKGCIIHPRSEIHAGVSTMFNKTLDDSNSNKIMNAGWKYLFRAK